MPEGPEVQTIASGLHDFIAGLVIRDITFFGDAARMVTPVSADELGRITAGARVLAVERRGKFIDLALDSGLHLFIHLMMTGRLVFRDNTHPVEPPRFLRCVFTFDGGAELYLGDQRKWAVLLCLPADQIETDKHFCKLGVDVLTDNFTWAHFRALLTSRRNLHTLLLDQTKLSGLGNIYVNEALYQAGLHPLRPASSLSEAEALALYYAIYHVVREAVRQLGTSFSDYWMPDGTRGEFQNFLHVFRRAGEPCLRCGTVIERMSMGGRGAFFCPRDQRLEPGESPPPPAAHIPGAPPPNHLFTVRDAFLATRVAAQVPFLHLVDAGDAGRIESVLWSGSDAIIALAEPEAAALTARYPNAHRLALEPGSAGAQHDATLHAAFDAIFATRCRTARQARP